MFSAELNSALKDLIRKVEILTLKVDHNRELLDVIVSRMPTTVLTVPINTKIQNVKSRLPIQVIEELNELEHDVTVDKDAVTALVIIQTFSSFETLGSRKLVKLISLILN